MVQLEIEKCHGGYKVEVFNEDSYIFITLPEAFKFIEGYFADSRNRLRATCSRSVKE